MSFPDMQVMLYFLIPIKMKYMAVVYAVIVAIDFFRGSIVTKVAIVFSLASVIISFLEREITAVTIQERESGKTNSERRCQKEKRRVMPMAPNISAPSADALNWIHRSWNSVTAPSAMGTMSIVRTTFSPMSISNRRNCFAMGRMSISTTFSYRLRRKYADLEE